MIFPIQLINRPTDKVSRLLFIHIMVLIIIISILHNISHQVSIKILMTLTPRPKFNLMANMRIRNTLKMSSITQTSLNTYIKFKLKTQRTLPIKFKMIKNKIFLPQSNSLKLSPQKLKSLKNPRKPVLTIVAESCLYELLIKITFSLITWKARCTCVNLLVQTTSRKDKF